MDKAKRAKLLRQRLKKLHPVAMAPVPKMERKPVTQRNPKGWRSSVYGVAVHESDRRKGWVKLADQKQEATLKTKRKTGPAVLNKIAEQVHPDKLKLKRRRATAEEWLAERVRR